MELNVRSLFRSVLVFKPFVRKKSFVATCYNSEKNETRRRFNHTSQGVAQERQPITIKMDTPEFRALFTPGIKKLQHVFEKYNHELRIVGGSIRDLLMRKKVGDVDLASNASLDRMKEILKNENIRIIQSKHATLTARVDDKENLAITSLRVLNANVSKVECTTDWYLDASCRDLTFNAMYMGLDGTIFDYFNGIEDLQKKRIRFVGNAEDRIREDYTRILRYFRFYGIIAEDSNNHDTEVLKVIKENVHGLSGISEKQIWTEVKKILSGKFSLQLMKTMLDVGVGPYIGLPADKNLKEFEKLYERASNMPLYPMTIVAALLKNDIDMLAFTDQMLISHFEEDLGNFIIAEREKKLPQDLLKYYQEFLILTLANPNEVKQWIEQFLSYCGEREVLQKFQSWEVPEFPVSGRQLMDHGILPTRRLGFIKRSMKKHWFDSSYTLTAENLLDNLKEIEAEIDSQYDILKKTNPIKKKRKKKKQIVIEDH